MTGGSAENRDPSPTKEQLSPRGSGADGEEDEPWDEPSTEHRNSLTSVTAPKKSPFLSCMDDAGEMIPTCGLGTVNEEEDLEEGELPSLRDPSRERPRQSSSVLRMQSRTRRPLNPPSEKGLEAAKSTDSGNSSTSAKRSKFFKQFELSQSETDVSDGTSASNQQTSDEEGPDDEVAARRSESVEKQRPVMSAYDEPKRDDETTDGDSYSQRLVGAGSVDEISCLQFTLDSLGNICGYGPDEKPSERKWEDHGDDWIEIDGQRRRRSTLDRKDGEQTAIEVEYMEEDVPASQKRKGQKRTLKNQSKKASAGTQENESKKSGLATGAVAAAAVAATAAAASASSPREEQTISSSSQAVTPSQGEKAENASGDWSSSKKNAYLAAMALKAKQDFEKKEGGTQEKVSSQNSSDKSDEEESEEKGDSEDIYGSFNPTEKRKFLKLINGGLSSTEASKQIVAERDGKGDKGKKKKFGLFRRSKTPSKARSMQDAYDEDSSASEKNHSRAKTTAAVVGTAAAVAAGATAVAMASSPESKSSNEGDSSYMPQNNHPTPKQQISIDDSESSGLRGTAFAAGGAGHSISNSAHSREEKEDVQNQFGSSGNSYYDAVRKEVAEADEELDGPYPTPVNTKVSKPVRSAKSQGYGAMGEDGRARSVASMSQKSPRYAVSPEPKGKKRILGLSLPAKREGFAALDSENEEEKKTDSDRSGNRRGAAVVGATAAAVGTTAAIMGSGIATKEDAEELEKIERELLRPAALATGESATADVSGFDLETPKDMIQSKSSKIEVSNRDMSLDTYLDSTTMYAGGPTAQGGQNDHMSVISGKSGWTAATGYTGASSVHTHSSRRRHRGAARKRAAKAKRVNHLSPSNKGWHESIRAAAAGSGREWDPEAGWVDYKDPDEVLTENNQEEKEKIRINLDKVSKRSVKSDENDEGNTRAHSVAVPFPSNWEKERNEMIGDQDGLDSETGAPSEATTAVISHTSPPKLRNAGWASSMRAASEKLGKDGAEWTQERGWSGAEGALIGTSAAIPVQEEDEQDLNDEQDFNIRVLPNPVESPVEAEQQEGIANAVDKAPREVAAERTMPSEDGEQVNDGEERNNTLSKAKYEDVGQDSNGAAIAAGAAGAAIAVGAVGAAIAAGAESDDGSVEGDNFIEPEASGARNEDVPVWSGASVASSVTEQEQVPGKYMQLGDNGSVRSAYAPEKSGKTPSTQANSIQPPPPPPPSTALLAANAVFRRRDDEEEESDETDAPRSPSATPVLPSVTEESEPDLAPQTEVVKEKVQEDDMNLFSNGEVGLLASFSEDEGNSPSKSRHDDYVEPNSPPRRNNVNKKASPARSVPVDLDAVDDHLDRVSTIDEDDHDENSAWSYHGPAPVQAAPVAGNAAAATLVPKLQKSKKDTEPIHDKSPPASEANSATRSASDTSSSIKRRAQNWESKRTSWKPDPPALTNSRGVDPEGSQGPTLEDAVSEPSEVSEHESSPQGKLSPKLQPKAPQEVPRTQEIQQTQNVGPPETNSEVDWPLTSEETSTLQDSVPAEWKSFLGKKVRAESAAAARQQESQRSTPYVAQSYISATDSESNHVVEKQDDDDSIFRFDETREGRSGAPTAPSSGDEFPPDISPIHTQDEDESQMEMKEPSDTGAVEQATFMQRMTATCAPILPRQFSGKRSEDDSVPMAHLAFMRTNPNASGESTQGSSTRGSSTRGSSSRYVPAALCGRPDIIVEEGDDTTGTQNSDSKGSSVKKINSRSGSTMASADYETNSAYLDSIASKSNTTKSTQRSNSRKLRSNASDVSTSSKQSSSSEAWKAFLERKRATQNAPSSSKSTSDVSQAAEKYAAKKVEEMMAVMSERSRSAPRTSRDGSNDEDIAPNRNGSSGAVPTKKVKAVSDRASNTGKKTDSAVAAEELAAARVEAMMAAMSTADVDEGEI